ncbi:MAG: VOC family protein [Cephaloticoccus sp.]|nr:VOC family protein [Cephaloticoccus sp.]MCF7761231.1 VOC family protein [Cephaloticoccus sp.]
MANPILGGGGFHHVCVKTRDWEATMRFYRTGLGCTDKITWAAAPQRAAMLDCGDGNYIEVFEDLAWAPAPLGPIYHFALRTTRINEVVAHLRDLGVKITLEPKPVRIATTNGGGEVPATIAFCEGPNGESVELLQNELT